MEKRNHNGAIKTVVTTITNLLSLTSFKKKKNNAPVSRITIIELVADVLNVTTDMMNFLSDELLF